ncbi:hypothetical protein U1Q18_012753, partial [Sarracenia purpurea var. burkii]
KPLSGSPTRIQLRCSDFRAAGENSWRASMTGFTSFMSQSMTSLGRPWPNLVSVKTPPEAPPLRIIVNGENNHQIRSDSDRFEPINPKTTSPAPRRPPSPSPSTSRAKPSPDRSSGKKKSPEKPIIDERDEAKFRLQRPAEREMKIICALGPSCVGPI